MKQSVLSGDDEALGVRYRYRNLYLTQAVGATTAFADFDTVGRFQNIDLIMTIRFAQCEVQRVAIRIYDQVAFEAVQTVFS